MYSANIELCKELYELSGWEGNTLAFGWVDGLIVSMEDRDWKEVAFPAYDLGFLLRKLETTELGVSVRYVNQLLGMDMKSWLNKWVAYHPWLKQKDYTYADTPEDSICELTIELFKQGLLKS